MDEIRLLESALSCAHAIEQSIVTLVFLPPIVNADITSRLINMQKVCLRSLQHGDKSTC